MAIAPLPLTLGDLTGDGVMDLVAAFRADNKIGVLQGNADGTFKHQIIYQVGTAPSAVVVADFNGDGKRDVAVANFKDSRVSVLFGNGDGTLQTAVHYPVGVGPESLVTIDPNNSGHADLVSANGNGGLSPKGSDVTVLSNLAPELGIPTSTTVTANPLKSTYGEQVDFTATVMASSGMLDPDGTVDFVDTTDNIVLCLGVLVKQQQPPNGTSTAECLTSALPAGMPTVEGDTPALRSSKAVRGTFRMRLTRPTLRST